MPQFTPVYQLPYPEQQEPPDGPAQIGALAQRIEQVLPNVGMPPGMGADWYAAGAPAGFLLCDGSAVSRTQFARLFQVIGTQFGGGDGINTFNLPDTRGRVLVGVAPGGQPEVATLGGNDGTGATQRRVRHAHTNGLLLPQHSHLVNTPAHVHAIYAGYNVNAGNGPYPVTKNEADHTIDTEAALTGITVGSPSSYPAISGTIGVTGGTQDGPSYVVVNKVIRT